MTRGQNISIQGAALFQVLRFFPLAFVLTDADQFFGLPSLSKYSQSMSLDDETEIPINFLGLPDQFWPERVDEGNILLASQETMNGVYVDKHRPTPK